MPTTVAGAGQCRSSSCTATAAPVVAQYAAAHPDTFQKQFPEIEVVAIHGAGHWLMLDKPDVVNAALDTFLARVQ